MIENMACRAIKLRILGLLQRLDYNEINATELSRLLSMVLTGACLYVRSFVLNYTALILLRCSCCCNQTENFAFDLNANDNALLWQMPWLKLKQEWIVLGWIYFQMYQIKLNQEWSLLRLIEYLNYKRSNLPLLLFPGIISPTKANNRRVPGRVPGQYQTIVSRNRPICLCNTRVLCHETCLCRDMSPTCRLVNPKGWINPKWQLG